MILRFKNLILPTRKMATAVDDVLFNLQNNKALISLNRPQALNALNLSMIRKIYPRLIEWQKEKKLDFIIIKGEKAFCAGGDIKAVAESGKGDNVTQKSFFKEEYLLNYAIGISNIPWISLVDGVTMGGGVGLSVHGKYVIATERTLFAMPETAIGLFPDVGGGFFLPRLKGSLGNFLALTGFRLKGSDVLSAGIATHFIDSSKIPDLIDDLFKLKSTLNNNQLNELFLQHQKNSSSKLNKEYVLEKHLTDIHRSFSGYSLEEILKNLKTLNSEWSNKQLEVLSKMSPTSMKVTLEQLKRGVTLSLGEVLQMEYRIGQRIMAASDFYEGVRAVLIDKDQKPQWRPMKIEDVSEEQVLAHFDPLPQHEELVIP